jgi:hypothetical protein
LISREIWLSLYPKANACSREKAPDWRAARFASAEFTCSTVMAALTRRGGSIQLVRTA